MPRQIRVQDLIGRQVTDPNGQKAGRIETMFATWRGENCFIEEYHLGAAALLERLGITATRLIGWPGAREPLRVPWQQLDLSDPEHPRLRVPVAEVKRMRR